MTRALAAAALAACVLAATAAGCGGGGGRSAGTEAAAPAAPPEPPPPRDDVYARTTLLDTQGRAIRLADFRGRVRLIDVWASWCGPCRMIIPHLNDLSDRYRSAGLVVIGVSVDDSPAAVEAFTSRLPLRYPVGMMNREIGDLLGNPDSIPTSYLVDRHGRLRRKFVGYVDPATIEREVVRFLKTP